MIKIDEKLSKFILYLALTILWTFILIFNISSSQPIFVIVLDILCVICWLISSVIEFVKYKKEKNNKN
jgi:hypothetical protein